MTESLRIQQHQAPPSIERTSAVRPAAGPADMPETDPITPDRAAVAGYGSGQAPTRVAFVSGLPPLASLSADDDLAPIVADLMAMQPQGLDADGSQVTAGVAADPEGIVTAWRSGRLSLDEATMQAGAALALNDGMGMVADAMLAVEAADAILDTHFADMSGEEQAHFTVRRRASHAGVMQAVRYQDQLEGMRRGETAVVVELTTEPAPATASTPPTIDARVAQRWGLSQRQASSINRVVGDMAAPDAPAPTRPRGHRVRMGPGALDRLQALDQVFSGGDADKARRFRQGATAAAQTGIRIDDPVHGDVARYLVEAARANPKALGRLIHVDGDVVRLNLDRIRPEDLERYLPLQPLPDVLALVAERVAGTSPEQMAQFGDLLHHAMTEQGIDLDDPRYGGMARALLTHLQGMRETQDLVEVRDGRLTIRVSDDDAQSLQGYFDYYRHDGERSAAAQQAEAAYDQAMATVTRALVGFETAIVFVAVYQHVSGASQETPITDGSRAPPTAGPVDSQPPAEEEEWQIPARPVEPAPARTLGTRTVQEHEQAAQANRRQQQLLANALQQSALDEAKHKRHLDGLRAATAEAQQRIAAEDAPARSADE